MAAKMKRMVMATEKAQKGPGRPRKEPTFVVQARVTREVKRKLEAHRRRRMCFNESEALRDVLTQFFGEPISQAS